MFSLLIFNWGPWIYNKVVDTFKRVEQTSKIIYCEFVFKKEWIFFKNNLIPVSSNSFEIPEDSNIKWRCELNPPKFIEPGSDKKEKHLSYLGFNVIVPGKDNIDLTDWISDIKYIGSKEPTVGEIFALWCCENCTSQFHLFDLAYVECITELGDTIKKALNE